MGHKIIFVVVRILSSTIESGTFRVWMWWKQRKTKCSSTNRYNPLLTSFSLSWRHIEFLHLALEITFHKMHPIKYALTWHQIGSFSQDLVINCSKHPLTSTPFYKDKLNSIGFFRRDLAEFHATNLATLSKTAALTVKGQLSWWLHLKSWKMCRKIY